MRRRDADEAEIIRLYTKEGLRAQAIAHRLGVTTALVYDRLEQAGVARSRLAHLPLEEAIKLYVDERWTAARIAERYNVSHTTVTGRLRSAGVAIRNRSGPKTGPNRRPCPRSLTYRAYVLGIVWGDFAIERPTADGRTIRLKTSTTRGEQVELVRSLFGRFGAVRYGGRTLGVMLDESFDFVEAKHSEQLPAWVSGAEASAAFAAGYIDAEGSFGVYEGRGRFRIATCDAAVLRWLHSWCSQIGVRSHLARVARRGESSGAQPPHTRDVWAVTVNEGQSLLRLIATLEPFARHSARIARMTSVRSNVLERAHRRDPDREVSQPRSGEPC